MAVNGRKQPNETVIYGVDGDVQFVSLRYAFEGLPSTLGEGEILNACITAAEGDALPDPGEPTTWPASVPSELSFRRADVRRYDRAVGEARISIQWGERFFRSGPGPDVESFRQSLEARQAVVPYLFDAGVIPDPFNTGSTIDVVDRKTKTHFRPTDKVTFSNILSGFSPSQVRSTLFANINKLYPGKGILSGVSVEPINQTQNRINTTFVNFAPIKGFAADEIRPGSKPVDPLPLNGEYIPPSLDDTKTSVRPADEVYEFGAPLGWL